MDFNELPVQDFAPVLTPEIASAIFNLMLEYGTADLAFKNNPGSVYEPVHFEAVDAELNRLKNETDTYMFGKAVVAGSDPVEYLMPPGDKEELIAFLFSAFLNIEDVVAAFLAGRSWEEFKALYQIQE